MEKLWIICLLFGALLFLLGNGPTNSLAMAFAVAAPKANGFEKFLFVAQALVFELAADVKKELDEIGKGIKQLVEEAKKEVKESLDKQASKEDIEALKKEHQKKFDDYAKKHDERFEKLQEQADALETKSKGAKAEPEKIKQFSEQVVDGVKAALPSKAEIDKFKENSKSNLNFNVKAAADMSLSNYSGGVVGLTSWDSELVRPPLRQPYLRQLVTTRPVSGLYVAWAELANRDGAANTVAEGAAKPQIDFDIVEASKKVEKIAAFIKASKESLDDIPFLRSEINLELVTEVNLKLDQQIYAGNGTTPNLKGITQYAPVISVVGLPFALGVATPNRADVLYVAAAVVKNSLFRPNFALVNPLDAAMIWLDKDTQGNSLQRIYLRQDGQLMVGDLMIVENTGVTVGTFVVGDMSKDILGIREEVNIQVGFVNDDFTKNLITILAELRAVNYIKTQNVNAFVQGTFSTVITAITKP